VKKNSIYTFLALFVVLLVSVYADQSNNKWDLKIVHAYVDQDIEFILIYGSNFGAFPKVMLEGSLLSAQLLSDGSIVAELPADLESGTHRLEVADGSFPNPPSTRKDNIDVTIGAIGPGSTGRARAARRERRHRLSG